MNTINKEQATILEVINRYSFIVFIEKGNIKMDASISKTLKSYEGKELNVGDSVIIEFSPFDLTRGRIHRHSFLTSL